MFLLYLDESGGDEHETFVLAGIALFEGEIRRQVDNVDVILDKYFPGRGKDVELHVSVLKKLAFGGGEPNFTLVEYRSLMNDIGKLIQNERGNTKVVLLGSVIHKPSLDSGDDPYLAAFEGMVNKLDNFLIDRHKADDTNKDVATR